MEAPVPPVLNASRVNASGVLPLSTTDETVAAVWTKTRTVRPAPGSVANVAVAVLPLDTRTAADATGLAPPGPRWCCTARDAEASAVFSTRTATNEHPTPRGRRLRGNTGRR